MADAKVRRVPLWIKATLFVSVALNLIIVGLVAGAFLRGGPSGPSARVSQDFALPFTRALSNEDRRDVGRNIRATLRERDGNESPRAARRADFEATVAAIRAEPFDRQVFIAAMERQAQRGAAFALAGREALATHLASMSAEERDAYADRVEEIGQRRGKGSKKDK